MLDEKGMPGIVERVFMMPPTSQIGPVSPDLRKQIIQNSAVFGHYEKEIDRESAYEKLTGRTLSKEAQGSAVVGSSTQDSPSLSKSSGKKGKPEPTMLDSAIKAVNSPLGRQIGRELVRGIMGSLLGGSKRK
jgi:DNA helicase HerA-like ATPase